MKQITPVRENRFAPGAHQFGVRGLLPVPCVVVGQELDCDLFGLADATEVGERIRIMCLEVLDDSLGLVPPILAFIEQGLSQQE